MNRRLRGQLTSYLIIAILIAGAYWLFKRLQAEDAGVSDECHAKRREILSTCGPVCKKRESSLLAAHDEVKKKDDEGCLEACSREKFGTHLPVCSSRR
jgi:hypothetical protein